MERFLISIFREALNIIMILKYVHIALRYFARHKMFSLINIFCLGIGISFCILIGVYIIHQWTVNTELKDIGRQYVLKSNWKDVNTAPSLTTAGPLANVLKDSYPNLVENYFRFVDHKAVLKANNKVVQENITLADTSLVSMYGFHLVSGHPSEAFRDYRSAVICASLALRLFGNKDVLDKSIEVQTNRHTKQVFTISAVLDVCENQAKCRFRSSYQGYATNHRAPNIRFHKIKYFCDSDSAVDLLSRRK